MSDGANRPIDPRDLADPSRFRTAAAGIIRDLLSAVQLASPAILTDEIRQPWWNDKIQPAKRPVEYFLRLAAANRRKFAEEFAGYLDSVPVLDLEDGPAVEDYVERLRELVLLFADPDEFPSSGAATIR